MRPLEEQVAPLLTCHLIRACLPSFLVPDVHVSKDHTPSQTDMLTFNCSLCSLATSIISATYSPKPSCSNAFVICSHAIVFLASFSEISFASDEIRVMNSTQHSISKSLASLPNARPDDGGRISVTIFWTVAITKTVSKMNSIITRQGSPNNCTYDQKLSIISS
jgi:hypothetical protein